MPFEYNESITPYTFPKYLWDKMQVLLRRFNARFAPSVPDDQLKENSIVWSIESRTPGDDRGQGGGGAIRPTFVKTLESDGDTTRELFTQTYTVVYRFEIFSESLDQLHQMAWEFERAFDSVTDGMVADGYGSIVTSFLSQADPRLSNSYGNSNLRLITLKFKVILPVQFLVEKTQIQRISTKVNIFRRYIKNTYNIEDTNPYVLTPETGYTIDSVDSIKYKTATGSIYSILSPTYDYSVSYENNEATINWSDSFLPIVGGKLIIHYTSVPLVNSSYDTY